ncbi:hypothetical protein [Rhodococcus globerulus]|uniref:HNH endonuclease n=1 Tax=Rhodococcus globerulus TaxID=33008 RepID=A0ABU4C3K9_RHOGO|nr:hypothetical protein [Rhodococcus globerulus]MDV6271092.1 hypothetical protein [Rhodococcus globerulus]
MLTVVIGPPAAGKSTWCREHTGPDDIIIDYDLLANALAAPREGESKHEHAKGVKAVTKAARQAAIDKAITLRDVDVYLIHSTPSAQLLSKYRNYGARIVTVDPGMDIVMERAKAERPWQMQQVVKKWYRDNGMPAKPGKVSPRKRGLDTKHDNQRTHLLSIHLDGTLCFWCGKPMYRDPLRNPDRAPLEADHSTARSLGGKIADRLLHMRCNRSRGDGRRDHLRPAIANTPGQEPLTTRDWLD